MTAQLEIGFAARDRSASRHEALIRSLVEIARELGVKAGSHGLTVSDIRIVAGQRGLPIPSPAHFLGAVPKRAGLVATDRWRPSDIAGSHGTSHRVWVDRRYAG